MEQSLGERIRNAWNVFTQNDRNPYPYMDTPGSSYRPDRPRFHTGNERSIVSSIYTRIALDVSASTIQHVRLDQDGLYESTIDSGLNRCLNVSANIDQTGRFFMQDVVMSMLDEGTVAIVPVDYLPRPDLSEAYNIGSLRTGSIVQWYPRHVRVRLYNDTTGLKEEVTLPKEKVAIIENPLYAIMNEPNSTLKRLIRKLNLLDFVDEQISSGKLDIIIQLPYVIKTEMRKQQAEARRKELENQLAGSKYGIAYTDGTERITQLNRPAENNLLEQVEYLTNVLYTQLGMSESIFNGTADATAIANYFSRTVEPIVSAITDEYHRKYLNLEDRLSGEAIQHFRDPFSLVPISEIPTMADKLTRNEIMSSNEVRKVIGLKSSKDPRADELLNKNMAAKNATKTVEGSPNNEQGDTAVRKDGGSVNTEPSD